jgi:hypothetical protein
MRAIISTYHLKCIIYYFNLENILQISAACIELNASPLPNRKPSPESREDHAVYYSSESLHRLPSTVAKRLVRHFTFGRSRVLTPVLPDQVWVFFRGFPTPSHRGMSHITDKGVLPSFLTHPSRLYPSRIFPGKALESLSSPPPFGV